MTNTPETQTKKAPIPSGLLLILSGIGFLTALSTLIINDTLNVIGLAGLGVSVLGLIAYIAFEPHSVMAFLRGRTVTFGGTALIVLLVVISALTFTYIAVRQQGWRVDMSEAAIFSLTDDSRQLVRTIANDPNTPDIKITGYLGAVQGGSRDRTAVLLDDYVSASNGKISYEFIDPNRNPRALETYGTTPGQLVITALDADSEPITDTAQIIDIADQTVINNALIQLASRGDFVAYVLQTDDAISISDSGPAGASILAENLRTQYGWDVQEVSVFDLLNESRLSDLINTAGDGHVLILPGGSQALPDEAATAIVDYLENGGNLIAFAGVNLDDEPALITAPNLSDYLWETFGLRVDDALVFDPINEAQSPFRIVEYIFGTHFATRNLNADTDALLFEVTHPVTVAETLPDSVVLNEIVYTSPQAYTKTGLNLNAELNADDIAQSADDAAGTFVLGAAAEDTATGARVIIFGSDSLLYNQYQQFQVAGVRNLLVARDAILWSAGAESFLANLPEVTDTMSPSLQPLLATDQQLSSLTYVSVLLLPFGVLGLGLYMWWSRRERPTAA